MPTGMPTEPGLGRTDAEMVDGRALVYCRIPSKCWRSGLPMFADAKKPPCAIPERTQILGDVPSWPLSDMPRGILCHGPCWMRIPGLGGRSPGARTNGQACRWLPCVCLRPDCFQSCFSPSSASAVDASCIVVAGRGFGLIRLLRVLRPAGDRAHRGACAGEFGRRACAW